MSAPRGGTAVMARRKEPPQSLDYFPTPPWASRAGVEIIRSLDAESQHVCEPSCGEGHMASVLQESFAKVDAFDVFPYGFGGVRDWLDDDAWRDAEKPAWFIGNPPFKIAESFVSDGLERSKVGVAMLLRAAFSEGAERYRSIFSSRPPAVIAQFVERVAMVSGKWDPKASSATAYAWFIWTSTHTGPTEFRWIAPGTKVRLTRSDDVLRFTTVAAAPLFDRAAP